MCVLGMAGEFRSEGIAVNALWPATVVHTAAIAMIGIEFTTISQILNLKLDAFEKPERFRYWFAFIEFNCLEHLRSWLMRHTLFSQKIAENSRKFSLTQKPLLR